MTKEKMQAYENVRQSGLTNMFDIKKVISLSKFILTREDCIDIMENYTKYIKQFKIKR